MRRITEPMGELRHPECFSLEDQLRKIKKAWQELNRAESDMARMRAYKKMSLGMKADFSKASLIATESRRTIDSILGGVR